MSHVTDMIIKVRDVLEDPEHWTKNRLAENAQGISVDPSDPEAVCFCLLGATRKVAKSEHEQRVLVYALRSSWKKKENQKAASDECLSKWNDAPERTHTDIIEFLNTAIADPGW